MQSAKYNKLLLASHHILRRVFHILYASLVGGKLNIFRYVSVSATMSELLWIRLSAVGLQWWFGSKLFSITSIVTACSTLCVGLSHRYMHVSLAIFVRTYSYYKYFLARFGLLITS